MMVWSTWGQQRVRLGPPHEEGDQRRDTHNVVVVLVFGTLTVINSVGSGDLLDLGRRSRQADQLGGEL